MVLRAWCMAVGLASLGCLGGPSLGEARFSCDADQRCAPNQACLEGVCRVVGTFEPEAERVLRTDPTGTYVAARTAAGNGRFLFTGDMNGDGMADVTMLDGNSVLVLRGRGDRTFGRELARLSPPDDTFISQLLVADFNADGFLDIAYAVSALKPYVHVLRNSGTATFSAPSQFDQTINIGGLLSGDFTGDGVGDLFIGPGGAGKVTVIPGQRDGSFGRAVQSDSAVGFSGSSLVAVDYDGDGRVDVVSFGGNGASNGVHVFRGDGRGKLAGDPYAFLPCGTSGRRYVGQFIAGGPLELLVHCDGSALKLFTPSGTTFTPIELPWPAAFENSGISRDPLVADLNRDGRPDIVLRDGTVLMNSPTGFASPLLAQLSNSYEAALTELAATDFDGDGNPDVVAFGPNSTLQVAAGTAAGQLSDLRGSRYGQLATSASMGNGSHSAAADFDEDGRVDVALASGRTVVVIGQPPTALFVGARELSITPVTVQITDIKSTDFNLDGHADVVIVGSTAVRILTGDGHGTLTPGPFFALSGPGTFLEIADVNEDQFPDVVVASRSAGRITVLLNAGDGVLVANPMLRLPDVSAVAVGDLTNDGHVDLVALQLASNAPTRTAVVMAGDGAGHFAAPVNIVTPSSTIYQSLVIGDLNADGRADLVIAQAPASGASTSKPTPYIAQTDGTFVEEPLTIAETIGSTFTRGLQLRDLNHDGLADLSVLSEYGWWVRFATPGGLGGATMNLTQGRLSASGAAHFDVNGDGLADMVTVHASPLTFTFQLAQ